MNGKMNLFYELLERHISLGLGNDIALIEGDLEYTYSQIYTASILVHQYTLHNNILPDSYIICLLYDSFESIAIFLGLIRAGCVPFYINPDLNHDHYKQIKEQTGCTQIVYTSDLPKTTIRFIQDHFQHSVEASQVLEIAKLGIEEPPCHLGSDRRAAFGIFTSGSSGAPKGILHRHKDVIVMNNGYMKTIVKLTSRDCLYSTSKLYFAYGLNCILSALYYGAKAIIPEKVLNLPSVWHRLSNHTVTVFFSVPTIYGLLLKHSEQPENLSVRLAISAGEHLPVEIQDHWRACYSLPIIDGIGTTEILSTFISNSTDFYLRGSTGKLVEGFQAKLLDENKRPVPVGSQGVLWIKGDTYTCEYINNDDATKFHFDNGWFNTNDLFVLDENEFFHYHGRASQLIKCGARWISPYHMEKVICTHIQVEDCIVVGKRQANGLLRPVAYVQLKECGINDKDLTRELQHLCKEKLSAWQYPHFIQYCETLPRTHTGKKQYYKLMEVE